MKFTVTWLRDHLETSASLPEIAGKLVSLGLEVEGIEDKASKLQGFVVAQVVEAGRHPNADRLSLCYADCGTGERLQVVCGAPNVRTGMNVAFAPLGVTIPSTGAVLKKGKIRDVESFGMFCSAAELELGGDSGEILELSSHFAKGMPLAEALQLDDAVIDVSITPNRPDCFGVRGIARDLAASGLGMLKPLDNAPVEGIFPCPVQVMIKNSEACPDFRLRLVRGVKNRQSPEAVQARLRAIGQKPISALVDVTNYLTHDLCRPLHVFDAAKVQGNLTVRLSEKGEVLQALNDKDYVLQAGMTVITDEAGVISLAGIIGGQRTACDETTRDVLVECAAFDPVRTAQTGRALQVSSDARTRFERGVDPSSIESGLDAATRLVLEWCGGTASEAISAYCEGMPYAGPEVSPITLTAEKLKSLSGCDISLTESKSFLEGLGFETVSLTSSALSVKRPSWRPDVEGAVDLVEEILRLKGYDQIPSVPLPIPETIPAQSPMVSLVKRVLAGRGLNEAVTWSFMSEELARRFSDGAPLRRLANPMSEDLRVMRPSILPNLLQAVQRNHDRGQETVQLFEIGPQFGKEGQQLVAAGILSGSSPKFTSNYLNSRPARIFDIFDAGRDNVFSVLDNLGVSEASLQVEATGPDYYHPGRKGCFKQGNRILANFGEMHPSLIREFGLAPKSANFPFIGFEIFLDKVPALRIKKPVLKISPYPPVDIDFPFLIVKGSKADSIGDLINLIRKSDPHINEVAVFDDYRNDKELLYFDRSLGISVRLESFEGTFSALQIKELREKIVALADSLGAKLPVINEFTYIKNIEKDTSLEQIKINLNNHEAVKNTDLKLYSFKEKNDINNAGNKIISFSYSTSLGLEENQLKSFHQAIEEVTGGKIYIQSVNDPFDAKDKPPA